MADCAGTLIIVDDTVLLVQSDGYDGSKYWGIPKGIIEPQESPGLAAARETQEETGIEAVDLQRAPDVCNPDGTTLYVYTAAPKSMDIQDTEGSNAQFIPVDQALNMITPNQASLLRPQYIDVLVDSLITEAGVIPTFGIEDDLVNAIMDDFSGMPADTPVYELAKKHGSGWIFTSGHLQGYWDAVSPDKLERLTKYIGDKLHSQSGLGKLFVLFHSFFRGEVDKDGAFVSASIGTTKKLGHYQFYLALNPLGKATRDDLLASRDQLRGILAHELRHTVEIIIRDTQPEHDPDYAKLGKAYYGDPMEIRAYAADIADDIRMQALGSSGAEVTKLIKAHRLWKRITKALGNDPLTVQKYLRIIGADVAKSSIGLLGSY